MRLMINGQWLELLACCALLAAVTVAWIYSIARQLIP